ncbi:MAG: hypothetical protein MHM6MM_006343 [Cercozoa sp. M6MM]
MAMKAAFAVANLQCYTACDVHKTKMSTEISFAGRAVIVTGAGGALGRAYALEFGRRGAMVVVNDLGNRETGRSAAADETVAMIKQAGGKAVADYHNVVEGDKIVQTCIDNFGRVDIVINNAGILRDVSFHKMTDAQWKLLQDVHVYGAYKVTRAAWPYMREQKYGRIVMTASSSGLYGNRGQTNYSTAKLGLVGFAHSLAQEGKKYNIKVNCIAPVAGSAMTKTIMPEDLVAALKPKYVAPLVLFLSSEQCPDTDGIFEVAAGWVAKLRYERTKGHCFDLSKPFEPEQIAQQWEHIVDFTDADHPQNQQEAFGVIFANLETAKKAAL